jgi:hypothetical protein
MLSAAWADTVEESSKAVTNEHILFMLSPHAERLNFPVCIGFRAGPVE